MSETPDRTTRLEILCDDATGQLWFRHPASGREETITYYKLTIKRADGWQTTVESPIRAKGKARRRAEEITR